MISNGSRVFPSRGAMNRLIIGVPRSSRGTVNDVVCCEYRMCCEIILCEGFEHIVACGLVVRSVRTFFWKTCECRLGSARGIDDILRIRFSHEQPDSLFFRQGWEKNFGGGII